MARSNTQALKKWHEKVANIKQATTHGQPKETFAQKTQRIQTLLADFRQFVNYYFPQYASVPSADFHVQAAHDIAADPRIFAVLEWPREHAKSVVANILIPLFLKAKGELHFMVLVGKSNDSAKRLLGDLAAELAGNERYNADFGEQLKTEQYAEGDFMDATGCRFVALGRGQSPRGLRNRQHRPDYCVVDDIDDDQIVLNPKRTRLMTEWLTNALYASLDMQKSRFVMVGNRIHPQSILAQVVGDDEPGKPVKLSVYHSKVYAIDPTTGKPAWHQKYNLEILEQQFERIGYRSAQREYFHNPIMEGAIFAQDWIRYTKPLDLKEYDDLVCYTDPSLSNSKSADYKACVLMGKKNTHYHLLRAFVRKCSVTDMVKYLYDLYEDLNGVPCRFYMEANFWQGVLFRDFEIEGNIRGYQLPLRPDKRSKPNKGIRIEAMSPLFERGFFHFTEKGDPDQARVVEQLLTFEPGNSGHDDAPDAIEGAIFLLNQRNRTKSTNRLLGIKKFIKRW